LPGWRISALLFTCAGCLRKLAGQPVSVAELRPLLSVESEDHGKIESSG